MKRLNIKFVIICGGLMASVAGFASGQTLSNSGTATNAPTASTETTAQAASTTSQNAPAKPYAPGPGSSTATGSTAPAGSEADQMAPVIVTGSLIPTTADEVGPTEVAFVTNAQIQNTNSNNVFDALKRIDVSFSGGGNLGQELNNNGASVGESNLFIRNLSTLILLDGARLTTSPLSKGDAVDVNTIPLAFIDHIEVLKDGASTLYGSDAVGGVINIITKKNFSGAEIYNQYGFAGDKGDYYTDTASIVGGATTDTTSFFAGVEYHDNSALVAKDRAIANLSTPQVAALGGTPPSYFSGSINGVVAGVLPDSASTRFIVAGSPYAKGAPGYNPAITTPGPIGGINGVTGLPNGLSGNDAQREAELAAAGYIPVSSLPSFPTSGNNFVDTQDYGPFAYTPATTEKAFANIEHDIFPKTAQVYGTFLFYNSQSESELAPTPVPNLASFNITVPANNPYNPFGVAVGTDADPGAPSDIRYRFLDAGNRIFTQNNDYYHFLTGLKGDFGIGGSGDSDYHYNVSFGYDREESLYLTTGEVNPSQLQAALTPSATNPFINTLGTPTYNIFGSSKDNASSTTQAILANLFQDGTSQLYETNGSLSGVTPFKLPAGPVSFAVGGEFRVEELAINTDAITADGNGPVGGPQVGQPSFANAERKTYAGYTEINIPIISPDMKIPGVSSFSVDGSARIEAIQSGANSYISRVNGSWLPLPSNELQIRANFSQSFIVPTLYSEFGPPTTSANDVVFPTAAGGGDAQSEINFLTSPDVPNTTAQNFGAGFTYSPKFAEGLTVSADYYNVIQSGGVAYTPYQSAVNSIEALGAGSPFAPGFKFANGAPITTNAANQVTATNFGVLNLDPTPDPTTQKTAGVDIKLDYVLPWKQYGVFTVGAVGTYLIDYTDQNGVPNGPYQNKAGTYTDIFDSGGTPQGLLPKWQVNPYFQYDWGGFNYTLDAEYIPATIDSTADGGDDYTASGHYYQISDYYRLDMTVSYEWGKAGTPGLPFFGNLWEKNGIADAKDPKDDKEMSGKESLASVTPNDWFDGLRVTLGVNNVTDELPPFIPSSSEDNTDKANYDIIGRFFFFQVDKKF